LALVVGHDGGDEREAQRHHREQEAARNPHLLLRACTSSCCG
jgi:hypothetical protein